MELPIYQVDAFTGSLFAGNPAAVVLLNEFLPDATMRAIAAENNLSETAFVVPAKEGFHLRWFTPRVEVDLCGHATLASAFVLFTHGHAPGGRPAPGDRIVFHTQSGDLVVERTDHRLALDFPARPAEPIAGDPALASALGRKPLEVLRARDHLIVYDSEETVRGLRPDFQALSGIEAFGFIVTAPGAGCDFVSRFFVPRAGIPEDPVTGSAHCTLVPYWSRRLGKRRLHALQVSERGGELFCEDRGARTRIEGEAVEYLEGRIRV